LESLLVVLDAAAGADSVFGLLSLVLLEVEDSLLELLSELSPLCVCAGGLVALPLA
jgi:hypothetical protein